MKIVLAISAMFLCGVFASTFADTTAPAKMPSKKQCERAMKMCPTHMQNKKCQMHYKQCQEMMAKMNTKTN